MCNSGRLMAILLIQVHFCFVIDLLLYTHYTTRLEFSSEITYIYLSILLGIDFESAIKFSLARLVILKSNIHSFKWFSVYYIKIYSSDYFYLEFFKVFVQNF